MKKIFTFLLLTGLLPAFGMASPTQQVIKNPFDREKGKTLAETVTLNGKTYPVKNIRKLKTRESDDELNLTPVITNPTGTKREYNKDCSGIVNSWMGGIYGYEASYPTNIVWDGDDVYFYDILSNFDFNTYVKGTLKDDQITMELPQTIMSYDEVDNTGVLYKYGYNLAVLKFEVVEENGELYMGCEVDESITSINFSISENGEITLNLPGEWDKENDGYPEYVLGIIYEDIDPFYDGQWTGYCDFSQVYTLFDEEANKMPEGAETEIYGIIFETYGNPIDVAFVNDKVYFQGFLGDLPTGVVYGDISNPSDTEPYVVSIPQNQYIGLVNGAYFIYTKVVYENPEYDATDPESLYYILAPEDETYNLIFDPIKKTFTAEKPEAYLCFNTSAISLQYYEMFQNLHINYQPTFAGTPIEPINLIFMENSVEIFGYNSFYFTIQCKAVEGNLINPNYVYYKIFVDGEEFEFMEEESTDLLGYDATFYPGITEPTYILPISFTNMWDIYSYGIGDMNIGLYMEGITTLGVQTVYIYNEVTTYSEIVTLKLEEEEGSVESMVSPQDIISTEFLDMNGRVIRNPEKGIYIKRMVLNDGSVINKKIAK